MPDSNVRHGRTTGLTFRCHVCGAPLDWEPKRDIPRYFLGTPLSCYKCKTRPDAWHGALAEIKANIFWSSLLIAGARVSLFDLVISRERMTAVEMSAATDSPPGRIIGINCTPSWQAGSGPLAAEIVIGQHWPRQPGTKTILVAGIPLGPPPHCVETQANLMVVWVPDPGTDPALNALLDAFQVFSNIQRWDALSPSTVREVVTAANIAAELSVERCLSTLFRNLVGADAARAVEELRYRDQLNGLLPGFVKQFGIVEPSQSPVFKYANELRDARNQLVHQGLESPTTDAVARWLCSALFLFYLCDDVTRTVRLSESAEVSAPRDEIRRMLKQARADADALVAALASLEPVVPGPAVHPSTDSRMKPV